MRSPSTFQRLNPYFRENLPQLVFGALTLVIANFLDVQALVLLGDAIDVIAWDMGPLEPAHSSLLFGMLVLIFFVVVTAAAARFFMRWLIIGASRNIEFSLRGRLFSHLQSLSASFFKRVSTGDIMARATNDLEAVRLVIGPALMYISGTAVLLPISVFQMLRISPRLTLLCWLPLVLIAPAFYFFSSRIHVHFTRVQEIFSDMTTRVQETLTGIRVIKAYARESQQADSFAELSTEYVNANRKLILLQAFFIPLIGLIVGLSLLALVWAGGLMIVAQTGGGADGTEGLTQGSLIAFFVLLTANIWPLASIGWVFSLYQRGAASMARINSLLDEKPEVAEPAVALDEPEPRGRIELRDLTFTYPGAHAPALREITLDLPAGATLGLTGPVGCGKSTLAHLLARRFNPPRGTILIDGADILDYSVPKYRSRVSIVDQEPFLFSDTIGSNILFAAPDGGEELRDRVSGIARFDADVGGFPSGYETLLGERGINLSGGQRQRAALARALAPDPLILILDDALSAVDTHTEEEILRGLRDFMKDRTTILISHRVTTVSLADYILYLRDGRIAERGTHDELIALGGAYADLARKQQLAEEIAATA